MVLKLDRLPRNDPEEVNVFSFIDRLAVIEKELATVKQDVIDLKPAAQQKATKQEQRGSYTDVVGRSTAAAAASASVGAGAAHDHTKIQHLRQRLNDVPRKHPLPSSRDDDDFVIFKSRTNRRNIRRNR